jgi:large subunit ribosomal protein L21
MYAVVQTGGKQYKVSPGDVIVVEKLAGESGDKVQLSDVLMLDDGGKVQAGKPFIAGAVVNANIIEQDRADKIIIFKKKRRQNYRRKNGHRQDITVLRVADINGMGGSAKAESKKAAAPAKSDAKADKTDKVEEKAAAPAKKTAPAKKPPANKAEAEKGE